jgi:hypothetical protein
MLAVQSAVEGSEKMQIELLFRAINAKGTGKLSKVINGDSG